ncbi:uncharacterized protein BX663DRAFT_497326 [Cokeromyces recurvatus]|uniref:uncharacterized protein n=1 Tax=Cokeromyces recurvatus TaxID=90255 RepID=UPI0022207006|nr:uncharacterized protein BX663DRAFT_497326 [Cokeromyces recurvatus]KAI7906686.1 hypothetical protein BX663DRAFT_497326 [Cokeromyces recurvatus]
MNIFCPLFPLEVRPALIRGEAVSYDEVIRSISDEGDPQMSILCNCQSLAASINQQADTY